jgi:hypothetical protein
MDGAQKPRDIVHHNGSDATASLDIFSKPNIALDPAFCAMRMKIDKLVNIIQSVVNNDTVEWKQSGFKVLKNEKGEEPLMTKQILKDWATLIEIKSEDMREDIAVSNSQVNFAGFQYRGQTDLQPANIGTQQIVCFIFNLVEDLRQRFRCKSSPVKVNCIHIKFSHFTNLYDTVSRCNVLLCSHSPMQSSSFLLM